MNKYLPYGLGVGALLLFLVLILTTPFNTRKFDERITLRQKDKIPYGTYVASRLMPALFPKAQTGISKASPLVWDEDLMGASRQAVFFTAQVFEPNENELTQLNRFVEKGNYVFIIANSLSSEAAQHVGTSGSGSVFYMQPTDSLTLSLLSPPFQQQASYLYPGKKWDSYFSEFDNKKVRVLGTDATGNPNFIQLQKGRGKLFVHLAPLAFTNYFLLHKNNVSYFQKVVSVIPETVTKVTWNEYFLTRRKRNESEPNILSVLWQETNFRWALLTAIVTLLLYTLIESRRRRRFIPLHVRPKNDSLDFVRTLGRLYYDRKDHQNLALKMAAVFLDAVRTRYHITTQKLDADFIEALQQKTGHAEGELQSLIAFINQVQSGQPVNEQQLTHFHQQLESFYQNIGYGRTTF